MKYIHLFTEKRSLLAAAVLLLVLVIAPLSALGSTESSRDTGGTPELEELVGSASADYLLIDVRTPAEYESGFIPTAVNIPVSDLPEAMPDAGKGDLIILYCRSGNRSGQAAAILRKEGFTNISDFGGINRWKGELDRP